MENLTKYSAITNKINDDNSTNDFEISMVPSVNATSETTGIPVRFAIVRNTLYGIFTLLIITGNLFCLVVLHNTKNIRKVTKLFMISLTFADLLHGIVSAVPTLFLQLFGHKLHYAQVTHTFCKVLRLNSLVTNIASIFSLVAVNVDRYISIEWPLKAVSLLTYSRAKIATALVWLMAGLMIVFYFAMPNKRPREFNPDWVMCSPMGGETDESVLITTSICFVLFIALPFVLTIFMQIRIVIIVSQRNASVQGYMRDSHRRRSSLIRDTKVLKMFMIVTFTYVIAWLPLMTLMFYELHTGEKDHYYLRLNFTMLILCNHWWNISVYIARNRTFRSSAVKLLRNYFPCKMCEQETTCSGTSNEEFNEGLPV